MGFDGANETSIQAFESHAVITDISNSANHESVLENMLNKVNFYLVLKILILF